MKTSELTGIALDWAVAKCDGVINGDNLDLGFMREHGYTPSTDWAQGGPIIERERIELVFNGQDWNALQEGQHIPHEGATPLIAAMRCYASSKLGEEVELPKELI